MLAQTVHMPLAKAASKIERLGVIIGAMKCGTTATFKALANHPEIAACTVKEPSFFSFDDFYSMGPDQYEAMWDYDATRHRIALEATPEYTKSHTWPHVPERMRRSGFDFRFVYIMRNPVARCASHYLHAMARGGRVEGALRLHDKSLLDIRVTLDNSILNTSRYASQLRQYTPYFRKEQILLVRYETLRTAYAATMAQILRHFGVSDTVPLRMEPHNVSRDQYLQLAIKAVSDAAAQPESGFAPVTLHANGSIDLQATFMPPHVQHRIRDALKDDMKALSNEWGFDVRPWGFG